MYHCLLNCLVCEIRTRSSLLTAISLQPSTYMLINQLSKIISDSQKGSWKWAKHINSNTNTCSNCTFTVLSSSVFQNKICFILVFLVQGFYPLCLTGAIIKDISHYYKSKDKYLTIINLIFALVYTVSTSSYDFFATKPWWEIKNTNI